MYQYNKSKIILEKNGKKPISKSKNHINSRLFVTNFIKQGELEVKYCPTEDIIMDYFTKTIQGELFIKFWNSIMNLGD